MYACTNVNHRYMYIFVLFTSVLTKVGIINAGGFVEIRKDVKQVMFLELVKEEAEAVLSHLTAGPLNLGNLQQVSIFCIITFLESLQLVHA